MFYAIMRALARGIFLMLGMKSEGLDNIPNEGAVIIAANHVSAWDPIVIGVTVQRPINYMGKAELFRNPPFAFIMSNLNAFPVKRGSADRAALRNSLELLNEGKVLGIFPEGTRNTDGLAKVQNGTAMIALKSGAPIVPVACIGTDTKIPLGWFRPLVVRIGNPIYMDEYAGEKINSTTLGQVSEDIMREINRLLCK
ncbi:MAG: lysophospholipid acyltransferase family protein [Syntrophomonadaceae bacterium]|nr:lysophospholipid acyltransferase family protein [Syntrophomonadaceae bacterium]